MAENPYNIKGTEVLQNKLGITDKDELEQIEADVTGERIIGLKENPLPGKIDYSYYKEIHKTIFDDLYDWVVKNATYQPRKVVFVLNYHIELKQAQRSSLRNSVLKMT